MKFEAWPPESIWKSHLRIQLGAHRNHLHGTLVGPNGAITSQAVEHALGGSLGQHVQPITHRQGQVRYVIDDAHSEARLGGILERGRSF